MTMTEKMKVNNVPSLPFLKINEKTKIPVIVTMNKRPKAKRTTFKITAAWKEL